VITRQQQHVRVRFPGTPAAELKLLPAPAQPRRPPGDRGVTEQHRAWVHVLPDMTVPVTVDGGGAGSPADAAFRPGEDLPLRLLAHLRPAGADAGVEASVACGRYRPGRRPLRGDADDDVGEADDDVGEAASRGASMSSLVATACRT
jgi:hypothetical protein